MTTFVDTSALYALLDEDDSNHRAAETWMRTAGSDPAEILTTHSYVAVEALALVRRRLGAAAARVLIDAWMPALSIRFVDEALHTAALHGYRASLGAKPSFVDHVSFQVMRDGGLERAFVFDRDFSRQGFRAVP